jgi:hypothetical protein
MDTSAQDHQHPPGDGTRRTRSGAAFDTAAPASPKISRATPLLDLNELSFRRAAHDVPFFAEPGNEEQDGPLRDARGLLTDMAQVFEALDVGFGDQAPLSFVLSLRLNDDRSYPF